ncbi:MAG TPA: mechanosensitive ion channel domain-containing protein [Pyrinomonadaceae bacterium]|nr:mechanosensitive ion channel domain-containing protein [Pyrinomonadaceae bacterium]
MNKLKQFLADLRASLWFVPGVMIFFSIAIAIGLIEVDSRVKAEWLADFPRLFGLGADGSRGIRTRFDVTLAELLGWLASFVITVLGVFVAAVIIFPAFKPGDLVAGLGITSVAVGFAFKDVLQNFFAGILILWRKPFIVGDQLKFKEYEGTVEEITVRLTRLKTFDGERAVIPNGEIYANAVLVKTAYDKRRVRFVVGIGYLDDIEKGRETIRGILSEIEGILPEPGPWIYVWNSRLQVLISQFISG